MNYVVLRIVFEDLKLTIPYMTCNSKSNMIAGCQDKAGNQGRTDAD